MCEVKTTRNGIRFEKRIKNINERYMLKDTVDIPEIETQDVIDMWAVPAAFSSKIANGEIDCVGEIVCHALVKNVNGGYVYAEKIVNFEHKIEIEQFENCECNLSVLVSSLDFTFISRTSVPRSFLNLR